MTEMAHRLKLSSEERRARPVVATDHIPDIMTFLMVSWRKIPELPDLLMDIPMRLIVMLSEFFQRHIAQEAVRQTFSPALLSRVFFSQIIGYVISTHQIEQPLLDLPRVQ